MRLSSLIHMRRVVGIGAIALLPVLARAETSTEIGNTLPADLKPIELRFKSAGIIAKVNVKEGDVIKSGQVLFEQDDSEERDELDILKLDATDIRVQAQKVNAEAKKAEYDRIKQIHDQGAQNDLELVKAEAEWKLAKLTITQEEQDLTVKNAKVKKQQGVIDRMKLKSPVDGVAQMVDAHVGEMIDPSKPAAITIVRNNPLLVEVILPTAASQKLQLGRALRVSYDRKNWKDAKVSYLAPMADVGSGLQKVHLSLENPELRASGLQIYVELPDDLTAAIKTAEAEQLKGDARVAAHQQ
jgi:multidrug efflux pump subunit AcrA (membrane-fusion protein)